MPANQTLPIAILQYLEWKIDPTVAAASLIQIVLIAVPILLQVYFNSGSTITPSQICVQLVDSTGATDLAHPTTAVWRALTDPAELAHWFPASVPALQL